MRYLYMEYSSLMFYCNYAFQSVSLEAYGTRRPLPSTPERACSV